jgi:hypothetical protein
MTMMDAVFIPHNKGSTQNPFFACNDTHQTQADDGPLSDDDIEVIPKALRPLYRSYPTHVEFRHTGPWGGTLLSIDEIRARMENLPKGCIDLGYVYMGMGHVCVYTYIASKDGIFSHTDGGACGQDRYYNSASRIKHLRAALSDELHVENIDNWVSGLSHTSG